MMKNKIYSILFFATTFFCVSFFSCTQSESNCTGTGEKVSFSAQGFTVDYQGNESLKFLHNKIDTQIFIGQGKKTYYTTDHSVSCPKDYEACTILFINKITNDSFNYLLENKRYQYYFRGYTFDSKILTPSISSLNVNNILYNYVTYFGMAGINTDTMSNYMAHAYQKGFIKIKLNGEIWELIP